MIEQASYLNLRPVVSPSFRSIARDSGRAGLLARKKGKVRILGCKGGALCPSYVALGASKVSSAVQG